MDRNGLIAQLRGYGNMEDLSERTDDQLANMIAGYRRKGQAVLHDDVCPYFTGVRKYDDLRQWIIGCSRKKGCDITPLEKKNWACTLALRDCAKPKDADFTAFLMCRFFVEARKELLGVKQKYICKCGKVFEKNTDSDTTGNRLGADFGPEHECFGCPFVVPLEEGYPNPKIVDYECRASKKISYRTTADIPRSREWFHVGRVYTLDLDFAREIWEFSRGLAGLDDSSKEMDRRGVLYNSDGRYCLSLFFSKTKAGVASCVAISDKFFAGGSERPGLTEEQEKQNVLALIVRAKKAARSKTAEPGGLTKTAAAEEKRSIEQITLEINFYKAQTAQNIIEIGKRLIEAKQQLQHGEWLPWLRDKVQFSEVSAQRFMRIAQEYSNTSTLTDLPYTKLLALLQVPEGDRDEFVQATHLIKGEEKTVSEMSTRELEQAIKERDEARRLQDEYSRQCKKADQEAQKFKEENKKNYDNYMGTLVKLENAENHLKSVRDSRNFDLQKITELENQIEEMESRPVDVAVQEPSENDKDKLRQEGAELARREYEQRLRKTQQDLEAAKQSARVEVGLTRDDVICASSSFRDSLDASFENFQRILRMSPADAVEVVTRECVGDLKEMISDFERTAALVRNNSLLDEDEELPPEDGMEAEK